MSRPSAQLLSFEGLDAPLHVSQPDVLRPLLDPVLAALPYRQIAGDDPQATTAFASIGPADEGKWRLEAPLAVKPVTLHEPIDAICDLVVEMSWERLRSRPDLLCLHAAAIAFGDRLVVFPNARRAGKSLLTATLAKLGHVVFSDDFVPVAVDTEARTICGLANGIAPRLRLPLPPHLPPDLAGWITARIGPANKRYGYLTGITLPQAGTATPIGAVVLLDREEGRTFPAALEPVSDDDAIAALVLQNFGRQVHAGAILSVVAAIADSVPVFRLVYDDVAEAAALLHESPALADLPAAAPPSARYPSTKVRAPVSGDFDAPSPRFTADMRCVRIAGYVAVQTDEAIYLADPQGRAIHRCNALSALIWTLMEEPATLDEVVAVMQDIFADIPPTQLRADAQSALQFLLQHQLTMPVPRA